MMAAVTPRTWLFLLTTLIVQFSLAWNADGIPGAAKVNSRDLGITHTLSQDIVATGDALLLTFSLLNHDPLAAEDIEIHLDIPGTAHIESSFPEDGEFSPNEKVWRIARLEGGNDLRLQLSLLNTSKVDLAFSASIKMAESQIDPSLQNNVTHGIIRVKDEDCMVVYNDFSECSDGSSPFLYVECVNDYPNNVLTIYDRRGMLVFEQEHYDNTWNGKRDPRFTRLGWDDLPSGTYYYVLSFPNADRSDKSGWIYLSD